MCDDFVIVFRQYSAKLTTFNSNDSSHQGAALALTLV